MHEHMLPAGDALQPTLPKSLTMLFTMLLMHSGVRHARSHYQHQSSSRHATGAGCAPASSAAAAGGALPHAASTDVLLPLAATDSCSNTAQQHLCKDAELLPESSSHHNGCLRHRNAGDAAGSSSGGTPAAAEAAVVEGIAVDSKEDDVAGMAFKESQQEVRGLLHCC
jgi:hypothetical protein